MQKLSDNRLDLKTKLCNNPALHRSIALQYVTYLRNQKKCVKKVNNTTK